MSALDGKPKRKYIVRLTRHAEYTTLIWARNKHEAASIAEKDFAFLAGSGDLDGLSKGVKCLGEVSQNQYCEKDEAYDINLGEWTSEQPDGDEK